jgi:hypothetical protein
VFGKVTAAFSVTEVQGRGALHAHCAIWGTSLTPDFLLKVSPCPLLVDEVAKVLDSMFVAVMPDEVHLQYLIGRVEKIKVPRQIYFASQPASHPDCLLFWAILHNVYIRSWISFKFILIEIPVIKRNHI